MNRPLNTWQLTLSSLQQNIPVMLLYVLESTGSSPGRQGFFMAVNAAGEMEGSIGGGIMEHKFVEMAKYALQQSSTASFIRQQVHDKDAPANRSGMICSGEQTILLYPVQQQEADYIQRIIASLINNRNGCIALSPQGLLFDDSIPEKDYFFSYKSMENWLYRERLGYKQHLFIIGGGHCALALSRIMRMMDFYIHLYDDRPDLNTLHQNTYAHEKIIVGDYSALTHLVPSGTDHYVVIMTTGYRTDDIALKALLDKRFAYIGILGSSSKIKRMFGEYHAAGVPGEQLKKIHAPVGLQVKSQTPEEIAVSIAAEIILVKNGSK